MKAHKTEWEFYREGSVSQSVIAYDMKQAWQCRGRSGSHQGNRISDAYEHGNVVPGLGRREYTPYLSAYSCRGEDYPRIDIYGMTD